MEVRAASAHSGALRIAATIRRALNAELPPKTVVIITRLRGLRTERYRPGAVTQLDYLGFRIPGVRSRRQRLEALGSG
jgi:hypothetical protein